MQYKGFHMLLKKIFYFFYNHKLYNKSVDSLSKEYWDDALKISNILLERNYNTSLVLNNLIIIYYDGFNDLDSLLIRVEELFLNEDYDYFVLLLRKGHILYLQNKYDEALNCFNEVLDNDSCDLWAYFFKCCTLHKLNELKDSELFNRINPKNCNDDYLLFYIARYFYEIGMYDKSFYYLNQSLKLKPKSPNKLMFKGEVFKSLEKYDEALDAYNEALKYNPKSPPLWNLKGIIYNKLKDYNNAIKCFDKTLEINNKYYFALANKSNALSGLGDYKSALKLNEKALDLTQDYPELWYNYGSSLLEMKDLKKL